VPKRASRSRRPQFRSTTAVPRTGRPQRASVPPDAVASSKSAEFRTSVGPDRSAIGKNGNMRPHSCSAIGRVLRQKRGHRCLAAYLRPGPHSCVCRNDEGIACRAGTLICALHQLSPIFRSLLRYLRVRVELVFKPTWESPERWAASLSIEPLFRSHHYGDLFINEYRTSVALLKALVQFSGHVSQHPLGKW